MSRRPGWLAIALGVCMALVGFASAAGRMLSPGSAVLAYSSAYDIWVIDLTRGITRQLTRDHSRLLDDWPSWSPDGKRLVYTSVRGAPFNPNLPNGEIALLSLDGREFRLLTRERSWDDAASWSPDGRYVAFRSNRDIDSGTAIYLIDLDTPDAEPRQMIEDRMRSDLLPSWSPDGTRLILHATRDGSLKIVAVDTRTGATEALLARTAFNPQLSPDGTHIAMWLPVFDGFTLAVGESAEDVHAMIATHLNPAPYAWSPDGLIIAFASTDAARSVVKLLDTATGATTIAFVSPSRVTGIAWQP